MEQACPYYEKGSWPSVAFVMMNRGRGDMARWSRCVSSCFAITTSSMSLIWNKWWFSLISWHVVTLFGGWQYRQLMCCFSRISLPLFICSWPAGQSITPLPLWTGPLHVNRRRSQANQMANSRLMYIVCVFYIMVEKCECEFKLLEIMVQFIRLH